MPETLWGISAAIFHPGKKSGKKCLTNQRPDDNIGGLSDERVSREDGCRKKFSKKRKKLLDIGTAFW